MKISRRRQIVVSAPGKLFFIGEHTVVYGKPALLASLDLRCSVTITDNPQGLVISSRVGNSFIKKALAIFSTRYKQGQLPPVKIDISSSIPVGSGLGSSAALSVALSAALIRYFKGIWNPQAINDLSYQMEKISHGDPSGADNTTATYGGLVWFRKELPFLRVLYNLPQTTFHLPQLILLDTGRPVESTKEMVVLVKKRYQKNILGMERLFTSQEENTRNLLLSLKENDQDLLLSSVDKAEEILERIGVVGEYAKKVISDIKKVGCSAKVVGAGGVKKGSGFLLCIGKELKAIKRVAEEHHLRTLPVVLGGEGVRLEKKYE